MIAQFAVPEMRFSRLSLAVVRPLHQPLLAVSATGGAHRRCPRCLHRSSSKIQSLRKKKPAREGRFLFWRRWRDLNSVGCFASFYSLPCGKLTRFQTTPTSRKKKPTQKGRFLFWRRWRDLNSRGAINTLPHFECGPFSHLGTSPYNCLLYTSFPAFVNH